MELLEMELLEMELLEMELLERLLETEALVSELLGVDADSEELVERIDEDAPEDPLHVPNPCWQPVLQ
jgi:hypothetical protein